MMPIGSFAQATAPSDPGNSPETGTPLGGGAPVGGGLFIMLGLGAAYGGKKVFHLLAADKDNIQA